MAWVGDQLVLTPIEAPGPSTSFPTTNSSREDSVDATEEEDEFTLATNENEASNLKKKPTWDKEGETIDHSKINFADGTIPQSMTAGTHVASSAGMNTKSRYDKLSRFEPGVKPRRLSSVPRGIDTSYHLCLDKMQAQGHPRNPNIIFFSLPYVPIGRNFYQSKLEPRLGPATRIAGPHGPNTTLMWVWQTAVHSTQFTMPDMAQVTSFNAPAGVWAPSLVSIPEQILSGTAPPPSEDVKAALKNFWRSKDRKRRRSGDRSYEKSSKDVEACRESLPDDILDSHHREAAAILASMSQAPTSGYQAPESSCRSTLPGASSTEMVEGHNERTSEWSSPDYLQTTASLAHDQLVVKMNLPPRTVLPPLLPIGSSRCVYISESFPPRWSTSQRKELILIFQSQNVPLCVSRGFKRSRPINDHNSRLISTNVLPSTTLLYANTETKISGIGKSRKSRKMHSQPPLKAPVHHVQPEPAATVFPAWPAGDIPVEVFHIIGSYLDRDSLQSMRLVNLEFEQKISNTTFYTVVVPFRQEIYGMMTSKTEKIDIKGKSKARETPQLDDHDQEIHDGMKVFEAWGPHIKNFAMAFEIDEENLANPPAKVKYETHKTFWGVYEWPHPFYNRYSSCEGLEKKADEYKCMSHALSNLNQTRQLGLSLDSGLGWLCGPDISDREQLFSKKPEVFGKRNNVPDKKPTSARELWQGILSSLQESKLQQAADQADSEDDVNKAIKISIPDVFAFQAGLIQVYNARTGEATDIVRTSRRESAPKSEDETVKENNPLVFHGIDVDDPDWATPREDASVASIPLKPKSLSKAQEEWLLETEWAQRAFLSSFCMALCDNSDIFANVHCLKIGKLSSRYLSMLQRGDVWSALKNLSDLTINVSADWRNIIKTDGGVAEAPAVYPSLAATQFYALLNDYVAPLENVKKLRIGYVGGGEHQIGIFGRNKNVLPAPLICFDNARALMDPSVTVLQCPHVEELTFTNCWFTPQMMKTFVEQMDKGKMKVLNLNSVSLTPNTTFLDQTGQEFPIISPGDGTYDYSHHGTRFFDPAVGNFFAARSRNGRPPTEPNPKGWVVNGQRIGSWGSVINSITPGANMDFMRYAYGYKDDPTVLRPRTLDRINFSSCGYVSLTKFTGFPRFTDIQIDDMMRPGLYHRSKQLLSQMMNTSDALIGQIVPMLNDKETEVMLTAFPMKFGWDDLEKASHNAEDAQPIGGSGRFSGYVEKLFFPQKKI